MERALLRAADAGRQALQRAFAGSKAPIRGRIVRALARFAEQPGGESLADWFAGITSDEDPRARRAALSALGRYSGERVESLLIEAWRRESDPASRRVIVESLGKAGAGKARQLLESVPAGAFGDAELVRLREEALLRLRRTTPGGDATVGAGLPESGPESRAESRPESRPESRIDPSRSLPVQVPVRLHCRIGLEEIVAGECTRGWEPRNAGAGLVEIAPTGKLERLFDLRTVLHFGFPVPVKVGNDPVTSLVSAITSPATTAIIRALTVGVVRYRLEYAGGRQRALVLRLAQGITERRPEWINDPANRCWEFIIHEEFEAGSPRAATVEVIPRLDDPRFPWRVADVPAASHPTLAAALARVAGADARDVVWDPFVGSGSELIERARLGSYTRLVGSDIEPAALAATHRNLDAAGLQDVDLRLGDALSPATTPDGVTLVITNPPMGRRVHRSADLAEYLDRFVAHVAGALVPGGRMAWISPHAERSIAVAERAGLRAELRRSVDMGGFRAELQLLRRPATAPSRNQQPYRPRSPR